jgi:hypothetical protein
MSTRHETPSFGHVTLGETRNLNVHACHRFSHPVDRGENRTKTVARQVNREQVTVCTHHRWQQKTEESKKLHHDEIGERLTMKKKLPGPCHSNRLSGC